MDPVLFRNIFTAFSKSKIYHIYNDGMEETFEWMEQQKNNGPSTTKLVTTEVEMYQMDNLAFQPDPEVPTSEKDEKLNSGKETKNALSSDQIALEEITVDISDKSCENNKENAPSLKKICNGYLQTTEERPIFDGLIKFKLGVLGFLMLGFILWAIIHFTILN